MIDIGQGLSSNPSRCPVCNEKTVEYLIEDITITYGDKHAHYKQVPYWKCHNCGERMFDGRSHEVMEKQPDYPSRRKVDKESVA